MKAKEFLNKKGIDGNCIKGIKILTETNTKHFSVIYLMEQYAKKQAIEFGKHITEQFSDLVSNEDIETEYNQFIQP